MAKNPEIQCTKMKLLTQPAMTVWIKKLVQCKIMWKMGWFYAKLPTDGFIFRTSTFSQQELMIFFAVCKCSKICAFVCVCVCVCV